MSSPVTFKDSLAKTAQHLETVLDDVLPKPIGHQAVVAEAMRYAAMGGGKRLRPFLLVQTAQLFGADDAGIWRAAAALECLHVYSLVHDDLPCMDDDDMRRGKPTVHKTYDEAIATLAGDALLTLSFELMASSSEDSARALSMVKALAVAGGVNGMIGGQVIDITVSEDARDEALITELQNLKTGALIEFGCHAGAVLAGASGDDVARVRRYARDMGLAFQIKDDILDVEGDADLVGKAVGKDADLGKATFVSILGLEPAREMAAELGERAKSHLAPFGKDADILCATVDFVLNRTH
ncbi:polyprenyl synthetase family protein [Fretibacter rubidus]|uniref:polyprenyl synthetase family protein n=1 Tax=Fretibacter rubidus TaxID=570162 RepID=UPI00352B4B3F